MKELKQLDEVQKLLENERGVLLYFYNDHCAPCLSLRPKVIHLISTTFPQITLAFVNSERYPDIPAHYGIFSNPALLLFIEGREYLRKSKYISESELRESIDRLYSMAFE
ncbi:MAG: thioredoxin family protein [Bacteroidales bacterium]|nr:thioredoxin family protein [Bacteroidales bacterium]